MRVNYGEVGCGERSLGLILFLEICEERVDGACAVLQSFPLCAQSLSKDMYGELGG